MCKSWGILKCLNSSRIGVCKIGALPDRRCSAHVSCASPTDCGTTNEESLGKVSSKHKIFKNVFVFKLNKVQNSSVIKAIVYRNSYNKLLKFNLNLFSITNLRKNIEATQCLAPGTWHSSRVYVTGYRYNRWSTPCGWGRQLQKRRNAAPYSNVWLPETAFPQQKKANYKVCAILYTLNKI